MGQLSVGATPPRLSCDDRSLRAVFRLCPCRAYVYRGDRKQPSGSAMPVTAEFSEELYKRLGHRVADELIDWFNQMDATYRADLEELNELNFARFDAKLEQRIFELRSELHQEIARLETRLVRWMFLFWVGTLGTMVALFRFWAG